MEPKHIKARPCTHFNIGDSVMVLAPFEASLIKDRWLEGKVVNGFRHHDGCVSVRVNEKYHTGEYLDGHGYSSGFSQPTILLKSEYDWLLQYPEQIKNYEFPITIEKGVVRGETLQGMA